MLKDGTIPAPGSNAAIDAGCTCPVYDNNHGRGACKDKEGNPLFWHNGDCKIHGVSALAEQSKEVD